MSTFCAHSNLVRARDGSIDERLMGERGHNPGPTQSGCATLVDVDPDAVAPGDVLVRRCGYGLSPVVVERVKTGVAGEGDVLVEVPVVVGVVEVDGQRPSRRWALAFAPEDLSRVAEVPPS